MDNLGKQNASIANTLLSVAALIIIIAGLKAATAIVIPVLLAVFIAILCAPLLTWLGRKGLPKGISLVLIIGGVILGGLLIISILGTSIQDFSKDLPLYETKLQEQKDQAILWLQNHKFDTSGIEANNTFDASAIMRYTARTLNGLSGALTNGFMILMIVIFMLMEASTMPDKLKVVAAEHPETLTGLDQFLSSVNRYMVIKTMTSFGTGVLVAVLLMILKVKYFLLWGLLAFLLNYIPNIGSIIAAIPAVLLALVQAGIPTAAGVAVGYVAINMIVGNVIEPRLMGQGLGLSTLVVFLSLLFWGWVLGPVGMLLSVPLTVMVKIALDTHEETRWLAILLGRK